MHQEQVSFSIIINRREQNLNSLRKKMPMKMETETKKQKRKDGHVEEEKEKGRILRFGW